MASETRKAKVVHNVTAWRIRTKQRMVDSKGGKCELCGYSKCNRALHFHHLDPNEKDFGLGAKGATRSWEKIQEELKKTILVCSNCHAEIHDGVTQIQSSRA